MIELSDDILLNVEKPSRYTGGEVNSVVKKHQRGRTSFALCFPDVYEVGMSHLGSKILYHKMNDRDDCICERAFAPWIDMEKLMREHQLPLFSLESRTALSDFDFLGFTLQYEMSYSNIINMLNLSGIPLLSAERRNSGRKYPLVLCGGPCAYNPEPLADIVDFFVLGEGEEVIEELLDAYGRWNQSMGSDIADYTVGIQDFLESIIAIDGIYVPSFYEIEYNEDFTIKKRIPLKSSYPEQIQKRFVKDLDQSYFPDQMIVPLTEIVHDRIILETFRGCTRGCRFCQAGMIYRPIREKKPDTLLEQADKLLESTGYDEISLSSLSICDYSHIKELVHRAMERYEDKKVGISLPSIRIDSFSVDLINEIQKVRKTGLTFAPEAGSQRMRDIINKGVTEADMIKAAKSAFELGWSTIKLYYMIGLPFETMEDVEGIASLSEKVVDAYFSVPKNQRKKGLSVTASSSSFVPKPFTPFQWEPQDRIDVLREKQRKIKQSIKSKAISYHWHESYLSCLEGVFSRGDRRLGKVLIKAVEKGCRFDGWQEHFSYDKWMEAFQECGVDPDFYVYRKRSTEENLPWDFINIGISKNFLIRELQRAEKAELTPDCRLGCKGCGITAIYKDGECTHGAIID